MPRRTDLSSILLIGSGPIIIGQACEFDYSGTQAAKILRELGYRVVLANSNPATIMTDPEFADATYIEPLTAPVISKIIEKERPDALLPTLGGQTALNLTIELVDSGVLEESGVEVIGASVDAIRSAEDRGRFKATMEKAGIAVPAAVYATSAAAARHALSEVGLPAMIRPSYILGGGGTGIAQTDEEFERLVANGLAASPVGEILVEQSLLGWKEFELEVMRDAHDNAVVVCSIENLHAMGVHTGDSITVAPVQTLSDREYQEMRDDALACLRAIGVETGGSNVQFAVNPATGERLVIEMNPRVSRSSALASKATGFPIAKIAAQLAVGLTLDEITNDITRATPASFEPALDYVVVKIPRFDFAKFPSTDDLLGTSMRSVGEAMAIGRTFPEALQKAIRSLETGRSGLNADEAESDHDGRSEDELLARARRPTSDRIFEAASLLARGADAESVAEATWYDAWFVDQLAQIVEVRKELEASPRGVEQLRLAKSYGFADAQLARIWNMSTEEVSAMRRGAGLRPTFKTVDTCAGEFEAFTPYLYSTFEEEDEVPEAAKPRVLVLGSGPNRIGQGVEFDYCCVHASFALREAGYESVMVNCNPETVSTDYDTSDRLYFEPLTVEDVMAVVEAEEPVAVVVQLGGQTPLNLATELEKRGVRIAGTSPASISKAEDREQFSQLCRELGVLQPPHGIARSAGEAAEVVDQIGFPVLVRPSFVLGGRSMRVLYSYDELVDYIRQTGVFEGSTAAPLLIDRFLEAALEVDVDAIFDGAELLVGGILEHVESAGVHSGDSACVMPPPTLSDEAKKEIMRVTESLAIALEVKGLINLQLAVRGDEVLLLEANPRGSRTVPFVSKAAGIPLAKIATRVMMGSSLEDLRAEGYRLDPRIDGFVAVKEAVMPWDRFPAEDMVLGPEMRATGEVMGIGPDVAVAYAKALQAAGHAVPESGTVFISLADRDKAIGLAAAQAFSMLGFSVCASEGTARYLAHHGLAAEAVNKIGEGPQDTLQRIENGTIDLIINTPRGRRARGDGARIRQAASRHGIACATTVPGALAIARSLQTDDAAAQVRSLQDWHR